MHTVGKSRAVPDPGPWPLRAVWLVAPLTAGPAFAAALDPARHGFRTVASVGLWALWAATLAAMLVPRDVTLTAVRVVVPASVVAAGWAASGGAGPVAGLVAIAGTVLAAALALAPGTTDAFVDGGSYGTERRWALRTPAPLLLGPVPLAWLVAVAGAAAGPVLLAAGHWTLGTVLLVVGWPLAAAAARALHTLSRRWVVLVPAGLVLHDPLAGEALLFPRNTIARLGPAGAGADERPGIAQDRTGGALGLVLELDLVEPVSVPELSDRGRRRPEGPTAPTVDVASLLFSPARPGAVLEAAASHRISVGS